MLNGFDKGLLMGILIGEGHFGGDGRQAHVTVRMHVRHESLFHWLLSKVPGSRLFGPYNHGGREYYQWMVRGQSLIGLCQVMINESDLQEIDSYVYNRFATMMEKYNINKHMENS